ncbi:MAG TPA: GntR family transcriptional regulator [Anaerolineaceae bacterium]|nr:GntR family transcriptional regulator [Anaerolineaceae bacterium]HPN54016.1 GntR family transcriptional regulator [Anaerolineaceae bacterium]
MGIQITRNSAVPLHEQLLNEIRRCIISGEWAPGSQVTSELTLQVELGISRSTIRQALNAARNEGLVETVAGKGTFVSPNPTRQNTSRLIGFINPYVRSSFDAMLFRGAENTLRQADYRVIFSTSDSSLENENRQLRLLQREGVAGIILWPVSDEVSSRAAADMILENRHLVLLDRPLLQGEVDLVTSDNFSGGYEATHHLIGLGHQQIVFLCRQYAHLLPIAGRLRGYRQAMQDAGLAPLDPVLLPNTQEMTTEYALRSYTEASGEDIHQICAYLASPGRASAIFASNDLIAMQVLRAAELAGLQVPRDISLVGYDDMDFCSHLVTPLTTIAQDPYRMGAEAARLLLERLAGDKTPPRQVILPTRLVVRASTAAPGQPAA